MDIAHPEPSPKPRWRPTPLTAVSMLLHAAAPATALMLPDTWPLAVGAIAGNHVVLGFAGLRPRSVPMIAGMWNHEAHLPVTIH